MKRLPFALGLVLAASPFVFFAACSATNENEGNTSNGGSGPGTGGSGGGFNPGTGGYGGGSNGPIRTCEEAAAAKAYIGCDFWPTVTANNVWSVFDYAVVVANAGEEAAEVTVTRGGGQVAAQTIPPNELRTIYLPWVPELKGADADACGSATPLSSTVKLTDGAYHLVSTRPVTVYQFSALEYAAQGGPPGKDWSQCPATQCGLACFSYSNDASLLLPSTAMTGNYRITGYPGWQLASMGPFVAITGTQNNTSVTVKLSGMGDIIGGSGIASANANGQVTFSLQAGEVAELVGSPYGDFSGGLVQADKPVQVISGMPCRFIPDETAACDHIEETVFPAETLGRHYFLTVPTGPAGAPVGHVVRLYGNVNGTALTYPGGAPAGAPSVINAGQVVDLGIVSQDFEVLGDHEFAALSFQVGAQFLNSEQGDPAQSIATAVEQYRVKYIFLAPQDYDINFVDVVQPLTAQVTLDGAPVSVSPTPISSNYGVARVQLGAGNGGAHVLTSTEPVGIQVLGYGSYTSYQYPGGSNLDAIAPPPDDVN